MSSANHLRRGWLAALFFATAAAFVAADADRLDASAQAAQRVFMAAEGQHANARDVFGRSLLAAPSCPAGSEHDPSTSACVVTCKGGSYRTSLSTKSSNASAGGAAVFGRCEQCPVGHFRTGDDDVKDACRPCEVGSSQSRRGQIACMPCSYQGVALYQDTTGAASCKVCPANTRRADGSSDDVFTGRSLKECTCEEGYYHPTRNRTGEACVACPKGADCAGGVNPAVSKKLYFGLPEPNQDYFLRCHRMCMDGYEGMSCSRCKKGWYRFQRKCVKCEDSTTETSLMWAYFFLLIAFYIVKKMSTIILPSMYIILTYVQCLSIVGNRQGWGTKRTKGLLKSTEIVNFSLDLFIPSCSEEVPYVNKAVMFTLTPVFYVLVDCLFVDPYFEYVHPTLKRRVRRSLLWLLRKLNGRKVKPFNGVDPRAPAPAQNKWRERMNNIRTRALKESQSADEQIEEALREEMGTLGNGLMDAAELKSPVQAIEPENEDLKTLVSLNIIRRMLLWAANHVSKKKEPEGQDQVKLTFSQKMRKHFFEDMRLMYVSTTGALLKALRCTPVGDRNLQHFWLSDAWFGSSVMSADPQQKCWTGQHAALVPYFVVMLILYAIGYPVAVLIVLKRARDPKVREGWHPKVYGRLYRRFEPEYYWWEVIYLVRRICLTSFRVLMNDRRADVYMARTMQGWQGLTFLVTLIAALLAQFYAHPFKLEHMDLLDATLLCCLFCIVWLSMAFEIALKETQEVDVLEALVFLVIAVSIAVSIFALLLDMYHSYVKSKKTPPKWIVFLVFKITPTFLLNGLGMSAQMHKEKCDEIMKQLEVAKTQQEARMRGLVEQSSRKHLGHKKIALLEFQLQRMAIRAEYSDSDDEHGDDHRADLSPEPLEEGIEKEMSHAVAIPARGTAMGASANEIPPAMRSADEIPPAVLTPREGHNRSLPPLDDTPHLPPMQVREGS